MIPFSWIAQTLGCHWHDQDFNVTGFSIDTRTLKKGDLFIAIKGEHFNGHDFIEEAHKQGAAAVLVEQKIQTNLPCLNVKNTETALITLAAAWRLHFSIPMVAVTGSCGKTSTRALIQGILKTCGETLASERSFNNSIGVPLTLLRLEKKHQYAVLEIGANHPGEIAPLTHLVKPKVALITLAAPSHLSGFGSLKGIATAKGEIFQALEQDGCGIVNQDDQFSEYWQRLIAPRCLMSFGINNKADVMAKNVVFNQNVCAQFDLITPAGKVNIHLNLMGKHNVYNALAAASAALALSIPLVKIKQGLESVLAETRRLVKVVGIAKANIIDDSYNANPASVKAAIDVLAATKGISILVLGDMLELGASADQFHQEIGSFANQAGVSHLFAYGKHSEFSAHAFGEKGRHFQSQEALIDALHGLLSHEVTVLVKGSNGMGMDRVVQSLLKE